MTKKQKKAINNLMRRKIAFDRYVKQCLENKTEDMVLISIVSSNGEFEWWNKENDTQI